MDNSIDTSERSRGPFSYENWRAAQEGQNWQGASEYPLFSDGHYVSELSDGLGPYKLLNLVSGAGRELRPVLILYIEDYMTSDVPPMKQTDYERYHGGHVQDEIAALVSLCLGARLKAGSLSRIFEVDGDPRGEPMAAYWYLNPVLPHPVVRGLWGVPVLPRLLGTHSLENATRIATLPTLTPVDAIALVRAARLYQEAVWIVDSTPELSWLMLTSAVETVAHRWRADEDSPVEKLRASQIDIEPLLTEHGGEELFNQVAEKVAPFLGATTTFIKFLLKFRPEAPKNRPRTAQHDWSQSALKQTFNKIYHYRSRALHGGIPFPAPMCVPPTPLGNDEFAEVLPALAAASQGGVWIRRDVPISLHMFEYIARNAILKWWDSIVPENHQDKTSRETQ